MELNLLNLLLVLTAAWGAGQVARRIGYPSVLGELIAGIVLGPPLLGLLQAGEALSVLAEVGVLLMMLYIGMEIAPEELKKASWGGLLAAAGGFITPFVLCYLLIVGMGGTPMAGVFVGVAAGVTSLATKSRILVDLNLLDTRIAHVMMAGALIADTASLVIFAAVLGVAEVGTLEMGALAVVAAKAVAFIGGAVAVGVYGFPLLARLLRRYRPGPLSAFTLVVLIGLAYAEAAHLAGMHGILGAFLAGLFLRESVFGVSLTKELHENVRRIALGLLAPIFFVTAGFAVSFDVFTTDLGLLVGAIGLATAGKVVGTALFYLPTGHGWREGIVLGAGMNGRGAVEIIIAQIALGLGLISPTIFSVLVFMALATTATVPLFLKWGTDWLRRHGQLVRTQDRRTGTLIIGAGPVARTLGALLARSGPVTVIDRNPDLCARAEQDGLTAVCGDALDEDVLSEAGAAHARRALALTPNPEVNALVLQRLKQTFAVPDLHVFTSRSAEDAGTMLAHLGATALFAAPVRLSDWDYFVTSGRAVRSGVPVGAETSARALYQRLQEERRILPLVVRSGDKYVPFHTGAVLHEDDRLIVLQAADPVRFDQFDRLVIGGLVLDVRGETTFPAFCDAVSGVLAPRLGMETADLARRMQDREQGSSTVLLPGLAVPHVIVDGEGRFELLLARYRDGVTFPGQAETVHAAFVIARSADQRTSHLRTLSAIAQVMQRPDFETEWLLASGPEALRSLVLFTDRRRLPLAET